MIETMRRKADKPLSACRPLKENNFGKKSESVLPDKKGDSIPMAKNKETLQKNLQNNPYVNRQEEIRKAKGNPNKNNHAKKKNSNYGGYTAGLPLADTLPGRAAQQERVKLPLWLNITLAVLFIAVLIALTLRMTILKDSLLLTYITSLLLGVACLMLFYIRRFKRTKKSAFYSLITVLLCAMGAVYVCMGVIGLLTMAGIL